MSVLRREIHPEARVLDDRQGIVEYVASDEAIDSDAEIIRADGWRFDRMRKNAPFVDSHKYGTIGGLLGKVVDFLLVHDFLPRQLPGASLLDPFPAFNVADSAITVGAVLLIIDSFRQRQVAGAAAE